MPSSKRIEREKRTDPERPKRRVARQSEPADWSLADPELVCKLVYNVTGAGGAVRFGYTSDGGAYAIGFYGDGEPYTEYVRPNEDINVVLRELAENWSV